MRRGELGDRVRGRVRSAVDLHVERLGQLGQRHRVGMVVADPTDLDQRSRAQRSGQRVWPPLTAIHWPVTKCASSRGQVGDHRGDVARACPSAERHVGPVAVGVGVAVPFDRDPARRNQVDGDVVGAEFLGPDPGQSDLGLLGGRVRRPARAAPGRSCRSRSAPPGRRRASRIDGRAAWTSRVGLLTKNSSWSRWACQVSSASVALGCGPVALATTSPIGPSRSVTAATSSTTAASSVTSARKRLGGAPGGPDRVDDGRRLRPRRCGS